MDVRDDIGPGEDEEVVVAAHVLVPAGEAFAPEGGLVEAQLLDLGRHCTIEDEDPITQRAAQRFDALGHAAPATTCCGRRPRMWQIA